MTGDLTSSVRRRSRGRQASFAVLGAGMAVSVALLAAGQEPQRSPGGPDAAAYGQADGYPIGTADTRDQQRFLVGAFSHFETLFPHRTVDAGGDVWAFDRAADRPIRYRHDGETRTVDDYMARLPVTGLVIAKDGTILTERYQYGRSERDRFTSQSMAKTVVAMLVGLAVNDHRIASVDDHAGAYVTGLGNSAYGQTSIRDLLHMSSGVSCPVTNAFTFTAPGSLTPAALAACPRVAPAGTAFSYSNLDTEVLGLVARAALGQPLATVLHDRVWMPMGAEASAEWTIDGDGQEVAFCCLSATLRDYARLGRLFANDGARDGHSLIPRQWLVDASSMSAQRSAARAWQARAVLRIRLPGVDPAGRAPDVLSLGGNGQRMFVDPQSKLVMVQTAVETQEVDRDLDAETIGLWLSLIAQFGH